jgi:cell division transport system ATP-binding protein
MNIKMIKFENVTKKYKDGPAILKNLDLNIENGEFVSIVGSIGAGKSTLLKMIYAELQPTSGRVYFKGRPIDEIKQRLLPYFRRNIGTIFQDFKLLNNKTIFENVAYALEVLGDDDDDEIRKKTKSILDIVGLKDKADMYPYQISGGEQQKTSLARALVHQPLIIIADEPTGNIDPISAWEIMELFLKINEMGTTVVLATHNKDIVDKLKKRVVLLDKGRIVNDQRRGKYVI